MSGEKYVSLWVPGRRTRKFATTALVSSLILLTVLGSIGTVLPGIVQALSSSLSPSATIQNAQCPPPSTNATITSTGGTACQPPGSGRNSPNQVRADAVPNLSLPKTTLSNVDSRIGSSELIQASPQNLTLRASGLSLRLLGGVNPHDELVGPTGRLLSALSSWEVQTNISGSWVSLSPSSSNFTIIGTNSTGTFVVRATQISFGNLSGSMKVAYKATSLGTLKWNIQFVPNTTGRYRLVYRWNNISNTYNVQPIMKKFQTNYSGQMYTMSWGDVPAPYNTTSQVNSGTFLLSIDLGTAAKGSVILIDPSLIGSSTSSSATAYTFQRKIFYEPVGGYFWVFYFNGTHFNYSNSPDGVKWATPQPVPAGVDLSGNLLPSVFNYQQSVVVAGGSSSGCSLGQSCTATVSLPYYVGTISGSTVNWGSIQYADSRSRTCQMQWPFQTCNLTIGLEYVNVEQNSAGTLVFSYIYYSTDNGNDFPPVCQGGSESEMAAVVTFLGGASVPVCFVDEAGPIVVPSNSLGQVTLLYEASGYLDAAWINSNGQSGSQQSLGSILSLSAFSAVSDDNYEIHVIFNAPDTTTVYAYLSATPGSSWTTQQNIFPGKTQPATLTLDRSTGKLYAFAINGSSIIMKTKPPSEAWIDGSVSYQIDNRVNPAYLGSNFASVSATKYNSALLVWTEGNGGYPCYCYNATFASIPIQTVWSPYSSPADPWTGTGVAPYGQYFKNLGEFVSPSSGMLTVKQTDLTVPGRGLDLDLTRVYVEPYSFSNNVALNDSESWIPMGNGWQFNFPWMGRVLYPPVIHLRDGQGYRIPSNFWAGTTSTFENHQGQNFRLVRISNGTITLFDGSGISYSFDSSHKLNTITDATGNNTITFTYTNTVVSCITDTAGRAFTFAYASGLLQTIAQASGSCINPGSTVRSISYTNSGQKLVSVTDPVGRTTFYSYNATSISTVAAWLLSRIKYPTLWLTNYTYTPVILGAQTVTYRVNLEKTGPSPTSPIRQYQYSYTNPVGDQITSASVAAFNGTQLASYTKYAFSFLGDTRNITDANGKFVTGTQQLYGVDGQIPREIVLVTDGQHIGSYTNFYNNDLWGNQIYSRRAINSTSNRNHDTFNAYYNNGLPPGFNAFQDTFSQLNGTSSDNPWLTYNGTWRVRNGVYNGTETGLSADSAFAWANISRTDLSLQSRISVTRALDTRPGYLKFGIFTHHSTWLYKWALVIHTVGSYQYQEFLDEWNAWLGDTQPSARSSCSSWTIPLVSYGVWYTFNVTIHGDVATGWVSAPGQSPCSVNGTFSSSSPAVSGMGFGLYAGGFSALFDNVTAATVSSTITGTSFSNSFIQNGAPNLNIHGAAAGRAQLQNGAGSLPEETYYSYYPWGGLSQTKTRYDPPAAQGTPNPVALDGSAQGFCTNATSSCPATITTSHANDIIIAYVSETLDLQTTCSFTVSDTAGLAWFSRGPSVSGRGGQDQLQEFWARSPNALTSDIVTESITGCGNNYNGLEVFGTTGANLSIPFDPNLGAQATGSDATGGQKYVTSATISTGNPNDFVFAGVQHGTGAVPTAQSGFTLITSAGGYGTEYKLTSSIVANYTVSFNFGTSSYYQEIADAVQSNPPTQWLTTSRTYDAYGNPKTIVDPMGDTTYDSYSSSFAGAFLTNETRILSGSAPTFSDDFNDGNYNGWTVGAGTWSVVNGELSSSGTGNEYISAGNTSWQTALVQAQVKILSGVDVSIDFLWDGVSNYYRMQTYNSYQNLYLYKMQGQTTTLLASSSLSGIDATKWHTWRSEVMGGTIRLFLDNEEKIQYTDPTPYKTGMIKLRTNNSQVHYDNVQVGTGQTAITALFSYDLSTGTLISSTDPMNNVTRYQYDTLTRVTNTTYPLGAFTQYTYNDLANYVNITNENHWLTQQRYDGLSRLTTSNRFMNLKLYSNETNTYNWQDKIVTTRDPLGNKYNFTYDALGRVTRSTAPNGKSVLQFYNDLASWTNSTDQDGNTRCTYYDRLGRLISVVEYAASGCTPKTLSSYTYVTNYYYDEVGNLGRVTNAAGRSTSYSYNNLNRLTSIGYPDGTFETYAYDNNGNLVKKVDRAAVKTLSSYDSINRPVTTSYCGATIISTTSTYDKNSNRLQVLNQNATVTYIYDARNRALNTTYAINPTTRTAVDLGCVGNGGSLTRSGGVSSTYTLGFTYNGELLNTLMYPTISQSNPDITIKYSYDGLGRVLNVTQSGTSNYYARSFTYYKNDQVKGFQFGNNLIQNYTYDTLSRPSTIRLTGTTTMSLAYAYNNTGTVASGTGLVNGATMNETYRYDPLQRLTNSTVKSSGSTTTSWYEYDNLGNRVRQKLNSTITRYSYNSVNELTNSTTYSTPQTTIAYSYDPNGNLKTQNVTTSETVRWAYTWDASNRLLIATNSTGQVLYAYDGMGRMTEAVEGASTWFFAYQATDILYKNLSGGSNNAYVYAAGLRIAMVTDRTAIYYYHTDSLGSTRIVTYTDATYVYTNNYQPFGQDNGTPKGSLKNSETDKFAGERLTAATGLFYDFQRWYDSSIGRFISQDSFLGRLSDPRTLNRYVYVSNEPTTLTDASGMFQGSGVENQCERLHEKCPGPPSEVDIFVAKLNIGLDIVGGGAVLCVLVCPAILSALGISASTGAGGVGTTAVGACLKNEQECAAGVDTVVKDFIDSGSTTAIDLATKDATDGLVDTSTFWETTENARFWSEGTFPSSERSLVYHFLSHTYGDVTMEGYTQDALRFRDMFWDLGRPTFVGDNWEPGVVIRMPWGPGGIYTIAGRIISFWYLK